MEVLSALWHKTAQFAEVHGDSVSEFLTWTQCDITEWLQADEADNGYAHLSDDEIVTTVALEDLEEYEEEPDDDDDSETELVSHDKAVNGCLKWLLQQDGSVSNHYRSCVTWLLNKDI